MNRFEIILTQQNRTNKWLASGVMRNEATITQWYTKSCRLQMEITRKIATLSDQYVKDLIKNR